MSALAVDFSGARPDPALLVAHGIGDALGYVDNAPSRSYLDALAAAGVRWTWGYEQDPRASFGGYSAGQRHAEHANAVADAHGYPDDGPLWVCVSDGSSGDPNTGGVLIADYGRGWGSVSPRALFGYGNRYAVNAFNEGVPRAQGAALVVDRLGLDGGWLPIPWGGTPARDVLGQDANTQSPIAGTDLDRVWADWWAGGPLPPPDPPRPLGANVACVGHHWADGAAPGPDDDWYGIDGGMLVHRFAGDRAYLGIPAEALEWLNKGAPITPLSDGDLLALQRRSGWV